jgi:hypothetical protein
MAPGQDYYPELALPVYRSAGEEADWLLKTTRAVVTQYLFLSVMIRADFVSG